MEANWLHSGNKSQFPFRAKVRSWMKVFKAVYISLCPRPDCISYSSPTLLASMAMLNSCCSLTDSKLSGLRALALTVPLLGFPGGTSGKKKKKKKKKNPPANVGDLGDMGSIPGLGWEDPLEEGSESHGTHRCFHIPSHRHLHSQPLQSCLHGMLSGSIALTTLLINPFTQDNLLFCHLHYYSLI